VSASPDERKRRSSVDTDCSTAKAEPEAVEEAVGVALADLAFAVGTLHRVWVTRGEDSEAELDLAYVTIKCAQKEVLAAIGWLGSARTLDAHDD
jgi:hypothetical protein